jgi:antitoxin VapB
MVSGAKLAVVATLLIKFGGAFDHLRKREIESCGSILISLLAYADGICHMEPPMPTERHVRLFRNGRNQAVRIPVEFELPGDEAIIRREGDKLVIEPLRQSGLLEWLATIEPWTEEFLDIRDEPSKPEDIF